MMEEVKDSVTVPMLARNSAIDNRDDTDDEDDEDEEDNEW